MKKHRLTHEQRQQILDAYLKDQSSARRLSAQLGMSSTYAQRLSSRAGKTMKDRG